MSKDLDFFFLRQTQETERQRLETLEGRPWEVRGAGGRQGCPGVLEVQLLTPLSTLAMWSGRVEKEWNLDQCLSHPGTSFYCHIFLVEPLKALSLFLPQRPNKVPSLSYVRSVRYCTQSVACRELVMCKTCYFYWDERILASTHQITPGSPTSSLLPGIYNFSNRSRVVIVSRRNLRSAEMGRVS